MQESWKIGFFGFFGFFVFFGFFGFFGFFVFFWFFWFFWFFRGKLEKNANTRKNSKTPKKNNFQGLFHPGPNLQESWKIVVFFFFFGLFVFFCLFSRFLSFLQVFWTLPSRAQSTGVLIFDCFLLFCFFLFFDSPARGFWKSPVEYLARAASGKMKDSYWDNLPMMDFPPLPPHKQDHTVLIFCESFC